MRQVFDHNIKITHENFVPVLKGMKKFEYRYNDRNYKTGEILRLSEWDSDSSKYTGNYANVQVTHITKGGQYGIPEGYVIMSIVLI